MECLARLESDGLSRRNRHLGCGARVTAHRVLARLDVEHAEPSQFDAIAVSEGLFHALENRLHGHLRLGLGDHGFADDFVYDIQLYQSILLRFRLCRNATAKKSTS